MDNASKALIMAGAILIAIAIVGVGVYIFSSTSSITNSGAQQIDAAAAQMANSTLRQYSGTRVRGSTVSEFIAYVQVLNANDTLPVDVVINLSGDTGTSVTDYGQSSAGLPTITPNAYYEVTLYDQKPTGNPDGYYDKAVFGAN